MSGGLALREPNQKAMTAATVVVKDESRAIHTSGGSAGILAVQSMRTTVALRIPTSVKVTTGRVRPRIISTKLFIRSSFFEVWGPGPGLNRLLPSG